MEKDSALLVQFRKALGVVGNTQFLHTNPSGWLRTNICQILVAGVDDLHVLSPDDVAGLHMLLLPRLAAYTMACVKFYYGETGLFAQLKTTLSQWVNVSIQSQLISHATIQSVLWDFLSQCEDLHDLQSTEKMKHIVKSDIFCIVAKTLVTLSDDQQRKDLLTQKNADAEALLNLLQGLLDVQDLGPSRAPILTATLKLSKMSSLYPESFHLKGVEKTSEYAVAGGSFGDIWKGLIGSKVVAIKVFRNPNAKAYIHEALLWRQFDHPNVLPFYGVHIWPQVPWAKSPVSLVAPWTENGNIVEYLDKFPGTDRVSLLLDIAHGLKYLHTFEPPVIHGDLKGTNILIMPSLRACVADFGLCTLAQDNATIPFTPSSSTVQTGALKYQAPELLDGSRAEASRIPTTASDVYSFGCVCYELFTGCARFSNLAVYEGIVAAINHYPLPKPVSMDDFLWNLTDKCWSVDPNLRPSIIDIVRDLTSFSRYEPYPGTHISGWDTDIEFSLQATLFESGATLSPFRGMKRTGSECPESWVSAQEFATSSNISPSTSSFSTFSEISCTYMAENPLYLQAPESIHHSLSPRQTDPMTLNPRALKTILDGPISMSPTSFKPMPLDDISNISEKDIVIAVMGPSGTGKSSFIKYAMPDADVVVGHDITSCTKEVRAFACLHPNGSGQKVILVDTPGFDDTERTDFDILNSIAQWLQKTYEHKIKLTGILQFHNITEARMRGTSRRNLEMFQHLCGKDALKNVILTTTNWDRISEDTGSKQEKDLRSIFWSHMIQKGSRVTRFNPKTFDSAWRIIDLFGITARRPALKLQIEMVDEGKTLNETSAFKFLIEWWTKFVKAIRGVMQKRDGRIARKALKNALKESNRREVLLNNHFLTPSPLSSSFVDLRRSRLSLLRRSSLK